MEREERREERREQPRELGVAPILFEMPYRPRLDNFFNKRCVAIVVHPGSHRN